MQRSGVLCRETGVWGTCEAGSRARGEERTAALCVGKVALGGGAIGLGEETGRLLGGEATDRSSLAAEER